MTGEIAGRVAVEEGIVYGTGGGRALRCDIYTPPAGTANGIGILLLYGGGFVGGDRMQLRGYGIRLGRLGYTSVCGEYALAEEARFPRPLHDVKAAIRWMRANADRLGIDPQRIVSSGNSAGGYFALLAAGTADMPEFEGEGGTPGVSSAVAAAVGIYPPTDLTRGDDEVWRGNIAYLMGPDAREDEMRRASPISYAKPDFPPTILVHGTADRTGEGDQPGQVNFNASVRMYQALTQAGVPVELHLFAGQGHVFDGPNAPHGRDFAALVVQTIDLFLRRYVGKAAAGPTR